MVDSGRACFFNDLSESTKVVVGLQGRGLLKRWFVVEKWVGVVGLFSPGVITGDLIDLY
jgi:hypothetical protein